MHAFRGKVIDEKNVKAKQFISFNSSNCASTEFEYAKYFHNI